MSNENSITGAMAQFNASLQLMEAALVRVEVALTQDRPIPVLAKLTVQDCCEDIIEQCESLSRIMED